MTESINTVVVGAGVVGLAIARTLAADGRDVLVIDRHAKIGQEASSHNSEVIHAGLYYLTGSLKARLCGRGKQLLYEYCDLHRIAYERTGKLVVAVDASQTERLMRIEQQARNNGVDDVRVLNGAELKLLEPAVRGDSALLSPSTGIFDSKRYMEILKSEIVGFGAGIDCNTELIASEPHRDGLCLKLKTNGSLRSIVAQVVVNSAGLMAPAVARSLLPPGHTISIPDEFAKGNYFDYRGATPFRHLVYPLPMAGGLGIHATLDLAGRLKFGPDIEWTGTINNIVDPTRREDFVKAILDYWPDVDADRLVPGYAGVRPKRGGSTEPTQDFSITAIDVENCRVVNLLGIESPGLTASLAIGEYVRDQLTND